MPIHHNSIVVISLIFSATSFLFKIYQGGMGRYIFFLSVVIITLHEKINIWFVFHNYLVEEKYFQIPSIYFIFANTFRTLCSTLTQ